MNIKRERNTWENGLNLFDALSCVTLIVKCDMYNLRRALKIFASWLFFNISTKVIVYFCYDTLLETSYQLFPKEKMSYLRITWGIILKNTCRDQLDTSWYTSLLEWTFQSYRHVLYLLLLCLGFNYNFLYYV